jgi:hypothetical protein
MLDWCLFSHALQDEKDEKDMKTAGGKKARKLHEQPA